MVTLSLAGWLLAALLLLRPALCLWSTARRLWLSRHIPGPPALNALLGNVLGFHAPPTLMLDKVTELYRRYGSPWRLFMGPVVVVFLGEPEDLETVSSHPSLQQKADLYEAVSAVLGPGLISMNGSAYKRHRKTIAPAFRIQVLRSLIPAFTRNSRSLCEDLEGEALRGEVFDMLPFLGRMAVTTTCEALLGVDPAGLKDNFDEVVTTFPEAAEMVMFLALRPWYWIEALRRVSPWYRKYRDLCGVLDKFIRMALGAKPDPRSDEAGADARPHRFPGLLDSLLASADSRSLGREELVSELKHVCGAFIGTVTDLFGFLVIALSLYPHVQDDMHEELVSVLGGDPGGEVAEKDLERLEYTERVVMEIMRIFPVVPILARHAAEDVQLPSGGVVPRGSTVVVLPRATHVDERWFPDPFRFDPDRFLPENVRSRPRLSYLPFGLRSRICIGKDFGKLYIKCILATLIRSYRFLPDPQGPKDLRDVKTLFGISMHPAGGANVRIERR